MARRRSMRTGRRDIVRLRHLGSGQYEFSHPRCVHALREDMAEVHKMLRHDEIDLAEDELRWLLQSCPNFMEAHVLLGRIAEQDGNLELARGHYGYAYEIGRRALPPQLKGRLDHKRPSNRPWFEAAAGLIRCLTALGDLKAAEEVLNTVAAWDPTVRLNEL